MSANVFELVAFMVVTLLVNAVSLACWSVLGARKDRRIAELENENARLSALLRLNGGSGGAVRSFTRQRFNPPRREF